MLTCIIRGDNNLSCELELCQYGLQFCFNVTHSMYLIPPFLILFLPSKARRDEPEADICAFKLIQHKSEPWLCLYSLLEVPAMRTNECPVCSHVSTSQPLQLNTSILF